MTMSSLAWTILSALIVQAVSQSVTTDYVSENSPDYYQDESGSITCTFESIGGVSNFGLILTPSDGSAVVGIETCYVNEVRGTRKFSTAEQKLTNDQCEEVFNNMAKGTGSFTIPHTMTELGNYDCFADAFESEKSVTVAKLLVAPKNLQMNIEPMTIYEGSEVSVICQSEGGDPASQYQYSVDGGPQTDSVEPFKAARSDDEKKYNCTDMSHPNLAGGNTPATTAAKTLTVYYFQAPKPETRTPTHNSKASPQLTCTPETNLQNPDITYSWTRDGALIVEATEKDLIISQTTNETVNELYVCTAMISSIAELKEVKTTFNVTWDDKSTTTTAVPLTTKQQKATPGKVGQDKTTEEEKDEGDATIIIIVVVVVVTVIILIVVIVIIVVKRRNASSANVSKDAGPVPPKKGDAEQGNGDADVTEPMLQESEGKGKVVDGERGNP